MNQPLTDQQKAAQAQAIARATQQMQRRAGQSVFDQRGELDVGAAQRMANGGSVGFGEYLHVSSIPWPPAPNDSAYCQRLARFSTYIGELPEKGWGGIVGGPLSIHDRKLLHAVATLHTVGMAQGQERHNERSAAFADKFFREGGGSGTYWSTLEVREETCRLIYRYNDEREIAADKRLQVFEDARRFELCRLHVNTGEGIALLQREWLPELFWTGWAADSGNRRHHMTTLGWG